jgi:hypothetical protein
MTPKSIPVHGKALGVLGHTELFEPISYLLHRGLRGFFVA